MYKKEKITLKQILDAIRVFKVYYPEVEINFEVRLKQKILNN